MDLFERQNNGYADNDNQRDQDRALQNRVFQDLIRIIRQRMNDQNRYVVAAPQNNDNEVVRDNNFQMR